MVKFFKHALFIMLVTVFANTAAFAGCITEESYGLYRISGFETAKDTLSNDCLSEISALKSEFSEDTESIQELIFVGMADRQGHGTYDNGQLSRRRADYVSNMFGGFQQKKLAADDATARTYMANLQTNNPDARAVFIFVLWEHDACTTQLRDLIKTAELKVAELKKAASNSQHLSKVEAELNGIVNYCENGNEYLTHSQRVKIDEVLNDCMKLLGIKFDTTLLLSSEITMAHANLMSLLKSLSVWRDSEGNFNKARLASDALALVTLGTVGGVITSTLVKKNQIKKGFEAIQCSIGGNIVANYGDEFVVGPVR